MEDAGEEVPLGQSDPCTLLLEERTSSDWSPKTNEGPHATINSAAQLYYQEKTPPMPWHVESTKEQPAHHLVGRCKEGCHGGEQETPHNAERNNFTAPSIVRERPPKCQARPPIMAKGRVSLTVQVGQPSERVRASFLMAA
jgi:hypothetical protein